MKQLRKLTGLGVITCKRLLESVDWDVRQALISAPVAAPAASVEDGSWYASCVRTRFGIYFFKVRAGANIHNNRGCGRCDKL
ncbi:MAG: hypothetical protein ACKERG_02715 [Candidatus Hodgkinia cicadicola]